MALPKLNTPEYELDVPSTGEKIKYRPWIIKEQKILMMAQESEEDKEIEAAFANIISECTFGEIDPYENPLFDIEYIFLQLRGKSVGQKVKLNLLCPDDEKTRVEKEIDLGDVAVQMPDNHTNVIDITDDISMIMRYPKLSDMSEFTEEGQIKQIFDMVKRCVVEIRDGETIHNKVDISDKELDEFIDSMSQSSFELVSNFFETMPKLIHEVSVINPKTKKKNKITIEGLQSFF
jgi:hypothetical protein